MEEEMACERVQHCWLSCAIRSNPCLPFSIPASHLCTPSSLHVLTTASGRLNVLGISWFDGGRTGVGVSGRLSAKGIVKEISEREIQQILICGDVEGSGFVPLFAHFSE